MVQTTLSNPRSPCETIPILAPKISIMYYLYPPINTPFIPLAHQHKLMCFFVPGVFYHTYTIIMQNPEAKINVQLTPFFISAEECNDLEQRIRTQVRFPHPFLTKAGVPSKRRNKVIFGEIARYTIVFRGKTIHTPVTPWAQFPELERVKCAIEKETGQTYQVCVIQRYNSGQVGIKPHRDKEMRSGTIIASLSLGCSRTMRFERGETAHDVVLSAGTLCLLYPPTNDYWLHSIPLDPALTGVRFSLVFRNCE